MMIPSARFPKIKTTALGFLTGAILFISLSVTLKFFAGYRQLVHKECIILVLFGGVSGSLIAYYLFKIKTLNTELQQRVTSLESILPICSFCKKIRKPQSDAKDPDSWQHLESYITDRTASQFTHGVCPDCIEKSLARKRQ